MEFLTEAVILLGIAVLMVPVFSRLGFGSVLGYLGAGILVGPHLAGLVGDAEDILHFAEFGVVLFLFLIGLELQPSRLWGLRRQILGLGGVQVLVTGLVLASGAWALGLGWRTALVTGFVLALSSTAIAVQLWSEKGQMRTRWGRVGFSILLFQDIAVIPLLAIIPLLVRSPETTLLSVSGLDALIGGGAVAAVVVFGRFVIGPFLRTVVQTGIHELFTIASLFIVIGTAVLMDAVGLSMALGAFLAGVLLAESEYRTALVADIEPFKGLLMGLFFMAVGMTLDFGLVGAQPGTIIGLMLGLMAVKAVLLLGVARLARLPRHSALQLAASLAQGGEFAFVLFTVALSEGVLDRGFVNLMIMVVTLSMIATPIVALAADRLAQGVRPTDNAPADFDEVDDDEGRVILAGFGRMGQIVGRVLHMKGIAFTALDNNFQRIKVIRRFGNKVYFGDPKRLWVLRAAGADRAELLILTVDDIESSLAIVGLIRNHFPHLRIIARAIDRDHAFQLLELGVERVIRETFASSLEIATHALTDLGTSAAEARQAVERFREHDEELLRRQTSIHKDEAKLIESTRAAAAQLEGLFESDDASPLEEQQRKAEAPNVRRAVEIIH